MRMRGIAGTLCLLAVGCGTPPDSFLDERPAVVPAAGVLLYNGEPLDGATVVFNPTGGGTHGAAALTDAEGRFVLSAFPPNPGAVPGSYQVAVTKMSISTGPALPEASHDADLPQPDPPKPLIPEQYSDPTRSGLTAVVPQEGKEDLTIELQGEP